MSEASTNRQKYESGNPVVQWLLGRFLERVVGAAIGEAPKRVLDLGCGEGLVARRILSRQPGITYRGVEIEPAAADEARHHVADAEIITGDIRDRHAEAGWADVSLCLEVLEHLDDPMPAVRRIAEQTRPGGLAIVSVPWEPFFRGGNLLRGKYLESLGNHPEHVQQFGRRSFRRLLAPSFAQVRVQPAFPWLIALARPG